MCASFSRTFQVPTDTLFFLYIFHGFSGRLSDHPYFPAGTPELPSLSSLATPLCHLEHVATVHNPACTCLHQALSVQVTCALLPTTLTSFFASSRTQRRAPVMSNGPPCVMAGIQFVLSETLVDD